MSDIATLLDRTTPDDLPPVDVPELARRSRRRRARRRALVASAATASVLVLGVSAVAVLGSDPDRPDVAVPAVGPDGQPLTEPVGSWTQADDPPFSPRVDAFGGTLADGRVVVWGGHPHGGEGSDGSGGGDGEGDDGQGGPTGFADGGVFDPATGGWDPIPAAPVPPPTVGGMFVTSAQLVDDRLAVVTGSIGGTLHAAVYDTAEGRWIEAPEQTEVLLTYDAMAWDGETLVVARTQPGGVGHAGDGGLDWRTDAPVTLRWRLGDDRWTTGAPPPFGPREHAGAAFDGSRLALWGGVSGSGGGSTANDGAIYDVATDTWTAVPEAPLPGRVHAATAWRDGRLVVGGGTDRLVDAGEYLTDMAAYVPATGTWERLPASPDGGLGDPRSTWSFVEGRVPPLVAASRGGTGEPEPSWFYGPGGWEQAPLGPVLDLGGLVVTTLGDGNFGSVPYDLQVRGGPGEWLDAADAPFDNRMGATTVPTDDGHLVVVGGLEGGDLDLRGDAWVFDLAGG